MDVARLRNGMPICPTRRMLKQDASVSYDNGAYTHIQFLRAIRPSVGGHTQSLQPADSSSNDDVVDDGDTSGSIRSLADSGTARYGGHDHLLFGLLDIRMED